MSSTVRLLVLALLANQVTAQEQVYAREVWRRRWNSGRRAIFGGQGNNGLMKGREEVFKRQEMETVVSGSSPTTTVDALLGSETVATSAGVANSIPTSMPANQAFTGVDSRALAATTAATTITTCDPTYTGGGFTISGTGTLPSPTAFVKKAARSQQLTVNNQPYRIVGPNIYWLCQDENYGPVGSYTDKGRIREALAAAVAMGANTIRAHSCGISVGPNNPYQLEPSWNVFNDAAWDVRDYAIYAAGKYGLRIILPFVDNYKYYHGSKYDFINFRRATNAYPGDAFYGNRAVVNAFVGYIQKVVSHVNPYTGLSYANDPTILAWETGNELGGYINAEPWPTTYFTTQAITAVRKFDLNHLILDGTNGFYNYTNKATSLGLQNRGIAMVTDHAYPRNVALFEAQVPLAANNFKSFLVGESDWTQRYGGSSLDDFIAAVEARPTVGHMFWSLFTHDPQCCNYVRHNDGYSMYYPNGPLNTDAERVNILKMVQHFYRATGRPIPATLPGVACPQPEF